MAGEISGEEGRGRDGGSFTDFLQSVKGGSSGGTSARGGSAKGGRKGGRARAVHASISSAECQ